MRQAVQEIRCAVQRIDDPAAGGVGPLDLVAFLGQPAVIGARCGQLFADDLLGPCIGARDEIAAPFIDT
jgi:hypothetical protein